MWEYSFEYCERKISAWWERDIGKWFGCVQLIGFLLRRPSKMIGQDLAPTPVRLVFFAHVVTDLYERFYIVCSNANVPKDRKTSAPILSHIVFQMVYIFPIDHPIDLRDLPNHRQRIQKSIAGAGGSRPFVRCIFVCRNEMATRTVLRFDNWKCLSAERRLQIGHKWVSSASSVVADIRWDNSYRP